MKRTICILIAVLVLTLSGGTALAGGGAEAMPYSYTYDPWGDARESPNPFTPNRFITGADLGVGNFSGPQDLFVRGEYVYIADTGNNRIVVCSSAWELVDVIDSFILDGGESTFNGPTGVFAKDNGDIYIADTGNQRVVHLDESFEVVKIVGKPPEAMMEDIAEFLPLKIAVDDADRIFLLARNVNKGIMVFSGDGVFTGYIGANKVRYDLLDLMWKRIFSTRAQREQMAAFVPTEFSNIALDHQGFLYTTCSNLGSGDVMNLINAAEENFLTSLFGVGGGSDVQPVKRLNATGADVLIRNGWLPPIGDWEWAEPGGSVARGGPSTFVDIVPTENDSYFALDNNRGRIYAYDFQGNLLYVFGGYGSKLGYFISPVAIDLLGDNMLVLDARSAAITEFVPTQYGTLITSALTEYKIGNYETSAELWERVLVLNINYDLAYIGIGRALLRQDRYEEAMEFFKAKYDFKNYSKAFEQYRKQVVEQSVPFIVTGVAVLIVGSAVFKRRRAIGKIVAWFKGRRELKMEN